MPARLLPLARTEAAQNPPIMASLSPLPLAAVTYYTTMGCWSLVLALEAELEGVSIEIYRHGGAPRHAYVVDGSTAVDAFGQRPVESARAGADEIGVVSPENLLDELARLPNGPELVALIGRQELHDAAVRTARFIIETVRGYPLDSRPPAPAGESQRTSRAHPTAKRAHPARFGLSKGIEPRRRGAEGCAQCALRAGFGLDTGFPRHARVRKSGQSAEGLARRLDG